MNSERKITRIDKAIEELSYHESSCRLCPRECAADRKNGEKGYCGSGNQAKISHALLHFGEEPVLSGTNSDSQNETPGSGSGTIFFSGCNLKCSFCQNYQISWHNQGEEADENQLANMMLSLQDQGALNINLVSPTHSLLPILKALKIAYTGGLKIPLIYNTNSYEKSRVIKKLEGIVDIYLPDLKFHSNSLSKQLSGVDDYFFYASQAILEMYCQTPVLRLNSMGIADTGIIIRHLMLPGQNQDSQSILGWIAGKLSLSVGLSLMSQYYPCYKTPDEFRRTISKNEYNQVLNFAERIGFYELFVQPEPFSRNENLIPDFSKKKPFNWK